MPSFLAIGVLAFGGLLFIVFVLAYLDARRVERLLAIPASPIARVKSGTTVHVQGRIEAVDEGALHLPGTNQQVVWYRLRVQRLAGPRGGSWFDIWTRQGAHRFRLADAAGDWAIVVPKGARVLTEEKVVADSSESAEFLFTQGSQDVEGTLRTVAQMLAPGDEVRVVGYAWSHSPGPSAPYRTADERRPLTIARRRGQSGKLLLSTGEGAAKIRDERWSIAGVSVIFLVGGLFILQLGTGADRRRETVIPRGPSAADVVIDTGPDGGRDDLACRLSCPGCVDLCARLSVGTTKEKLAQGLRCERACMEKTPAERAPMQVAVDEALSRLADGGLSATTDASLDSTASLQDKCRYQCFEGLGARANDP